MAWVKRSEIQALLDELDDIEHTTSQWQRDPAVAPSQDQITATRNRYLGWYTRALPLIPREEKATFKDAYEGGRVIIRIRGFLSNPLEPNIFFDPSKPTPLVDRYQNSFDSTFRPSASIQRDILFQVAQGLNPSGEHLQALAEMLGRVPDYLHRQQVLGLSEPGDEAALQDLLHPALAFVYGDVRREDLVSQFAGGGSRVDFLLTDPGIVLETKMTRKSLTDRQVGEELLVDWGRYPRHPDCRAIFGLIYDPGRLIQNHIGLERDLTNLEADIPTCALVVR